VSSTELESLLEMTKTRAVPKHVAVVPDGNGRWARKRGLPRIAGHRAGIGTLKRIVRAAGDVGIPYFTLYAFSTENWKRPEVEVSGLIGLLREYLDSGIEQNRENGVRVRVIGRRNGLPGDLIKAIDRAEAETAQCGRMNLQVAFNYGGRAEIIDAVNTVASRASRGAMAGEVDERTFSSLLYTAGLPDPDLIIRSSGELRVSNFMLWQSAYAEFVSSPSLWPDFTPEEFCRCILEYQRRDRRFGAIKVP
jgi:undecaprenyl diphosphate synthase